MKKPILAPVLIQCCRMPWVDFTRLLSSITQAPIARTKLLAPVVTCASSTKRKKGSVTPDREVLKKRLGRFLLYRCGYATAGKLGLDRGAHISESSEPGVSEWTIPILRWPRSKTMGS